MFFIKLIILGKEANTQELDESLAQALDTWNQVNKTPDYADLDAYVREEGFQGRGVFETDKFQLQLRPAASMNTDA